MPRFGYYNQKLSAHDWATRVQGILRDVFIYHHERDVRRWWHLAFGAEPDSLADDFMAWRVANDTRLRGLRALTSNTLGHASLRFVCHKRAGRVLVVRKRIEPKKPKKAG